MKGGLEALTSWQTEEQRTSDQEIGYMPQSREGSDDQGEDVES